MEEPVETLSSDYLTDGLAPIQQRRRLGCENELVTNLKTVHVSWMYVFMKHYVLRIQNVTPIVPLILSQEIKYIRLLSRGGFLFLPLKSPKNHSSASLFHKIEKKKIPPVLAEINIELSRDQRSRDHMIKNRVIWQACLRFYRDFHKMPIPNYREVAKVFQICCRRFLIKVCINTRHSWNSTQQQTILFRKVRISTRPCVKWHATVHDLVQNAPPQYTKLSDMLVKAISGQVFDNKAIIYNDITQLTIQWVYRTAQRCGLGAAIGKRESSL